MLESDMQPSELISKEFDYIAETAHQAVGDRYRFVSFYIALATAVATALVGLVAVNLDFPENRKWFVLGAASVCFLMAVVGWLFVLTLIRLRQRWYESARAMNRIKEYVIDKNKNLEEAFMWRARSIPKAQALWNINFLTTLLIIIFNSLFLAISMGLVFWSSRNWGLVVFIVSIVFALSVFVQIYTYHLMLKYNL